MRIWAKTKEFFEGKFLVVRRDGSVPHWPHFVLGARDPAAPAALRAYANECRNRGFEKEYVASIVELADDFELYRIEQGNGDPEAPPHRRDNHDVIRAMQGFPATIYVCRDKANVQKEPPTQEPR